MWQVPRGVVLVRGTGLGSTRLNAFDAALMDAGIGNLNLVSVSSILPPGAQVSVASRDFKLEMPEGALLPVVYCAAVVEAPGNGSAALALGVPLDERRVGVIFEAQASAPGVRAEAEAMVIEGMKMRQVEEYNIISTEATVTVREEFGAAVAAAVLIGHIEARQGLEG